METVHSAIKQCIQLAEERYGKLPSIDIRFDLRGSAAGAAGRKDDKWYIRINREHLSEGGATLDHVINNTIPHEVAHIVCLVYPQYGKNHNIGWKRVCIALGGNGQAKYSAEDAPEAYERLYPYVYITTHGNEVRVSKIQHGKIQRGVKYVTKSNALIHKDCQFRLHA